MLSILLLQGTLETINEQLNWRSGKGSVMSFYYDFISKWPYRWLTATGGLQTINYIVGNQLNTIVCTYCTYSVSPWSKKLTITNPGGNGVRKLMFYFNISMYATYCPWVSLQSILTSLCGTMAYQGALQYMYMLSALCIAFSLVK